MASNQRELVAGSRFFTTMSGVPVDPVYGDGPRPGEYPYTRGIYPEMYRSRLWTMRMFAGFGTAVDTNARFKDMDSDGWMHTGDLAVMDDERYVNIVGRIEDMIIRGGENVYPREVEELLYTHPDIVGVQVIGVPDVRCGEEIMAWIQLHDGANTTEADIRDFCRDTIAHYKVPLKIKFTDTFPMTITGKIQKFKMGEQSIAELGLEDAAKLRSA